MRAEGVGSEENSEQEEVGLVTPLSMGTGQQRGEKESLGEGDTSLAKYLASV